MTRYAPEGFPFIAGAAVLAAGGWAAQILLGGGWIWLAGLLTLLFVFVGFFFRDPEREGPADSDAVWAPADGLVVEIVDVDEPVLFEGPARRISIFLSVFDVHVQRAPVTGVVVHREYHPGKYLAAWAPKASEINERATLGFRTPAGPVVVRQIAGLVARRIVTDPVEGDTVGRGERIGLIRFGSRVDLTVPRDWSVEVSKGDRVWTSRTVMARASGVVDGSDEAATAPPAEAS